MEEPRLYSNARWQTFMRACVRACVFERALQAQATKVNTAIQAAVDNDGCTLRAGGVAKPDTMVGDTLRNGYFVLPTILADVPLDSFAWKEEIFGPVLSVRSFATEDEAVNAANASPYVHALHRTTPTPTIVCGYWGEGGAGGREGGGRGAEDKGGGGA